MEEADARVDHSCQTERVVQRRNTLHCANERVFPRRKRFGIQRLDQRGADQRGGVEVLKRRAKPLAVGRIGPLQEEAEPHQVPNEASGNDSGTELVPDLGGAADERLLLIDPPPLTGQEPEPDVVRIPGECIADSRERGLVIAIDRTTGHLEQALLRRREPVFDTDTLSRIEPEPLSEPLVERQDEDMLRDRDVVPAEARRPATEVVGKAVRDRGPDGRHLRCLDEHLESRSPAVIGGTRRVEAEHLGTCAEESGRVRNTVQQWRDDFVVERA